MTLRILKSKLTTQLLLGPHVIRANPGLASRARHGFNMECSPLLDWDPEPSVRLAIPSPSGKEPMQYNPANPLIVQGDRTILLEVDNPLHAEARDTIAPFAELEKSPEHIHTYRLTPLSLWNAAAAGMAADEMIRGLESYSKFPIPAQPAGGPARHGQPLWQGSASSGSRASSG